MAGADAALPKLEDFPLRTYDKIRYGDTDRQGHVNNAVFATFFETGRIDILAASGRKFGNSESATVIARLAVDYRKEVFWPGTVEIGSAVIAVGSSSVTIRQALFQNGGCVATADSVIVQVDQATHRSKPFDEATRAKLAALVPKG